MNELSDTQDALHDTCQRLCAAQDRIAQLEAERGQWHQRGSIVGVIIRDDEGKDWRWNGQDWSSDFTPETGVKV